MQRIKMGRLADLSPGKAIEKSILARRVAVFNVGGKLYGIEADCKHMKATLAKGDVVDGVLTCSWHGWKYDLESGECLTHSGMKLKRYEIVTEGDEIFLILP
jgi:nitrite reductase (NADH) small subunit